MLGTECLSERDKRLKEAAESVFGSNPLPKLEKFTFKVSIYTHIMCVLYILQLSHTVIFQLEAPLEGREELICCSVKLSGSNVAEGVRECVLSGGVSLPVPSLLTALHSSCSNSVLIQNGSVVGHRVRLEQSERDKENDPVDKDLT